MDKNIRNAEIARLCNEGNWKGFIDYMAKTGSVDKNDAGTLINLINNRDWTHFMMVMNVFWGVEFEHKLNEYGATSEKHNNLCVGYFGY